MTVIADPHPGLEVAVKDGIAHRRRCNTVEDRDFPGKTIQRPVWPVVADCTGDTDVRAISWGFARSRGVVTCTTCYPA